MIFKYYTSDVVNGDGKSIGSVMVRVFFWDSPLKAHDFAKLESNTGKYLVNFRRVK